MNVNFCNFQNFWQTNSIKKFNNIIIIIISSSKKMMIIVLQTSVKNFTSKAMREENKIN